MFSTETWLSKLGGLHGGVVGRMGKWWVVWESSELYGRVVGCMGEMWVVWGSGGFGSALLLSMQQLDCMSFFEISTRTHPVTRMK